MGESLLIIFSVFLATGLTEMINKINDESQAKKVLHQLREGLISNKLAEDITSA